MAKIRGKEQKVEIKGKSHSSACSSEQCPWVSFRAMTNNSRYNLSSLRAGKEREVTLDGLYRKLTALSAQSWLEHLQKPKKSGLETMTYGDIGFSANESAALSDDTAVYIFRFDTYVGKDKGRIIGYKNSPCSVYHIIGYDIDFSAYDHG